MALTWEDARRMAATKNAAAYYDSAKSKSKRDADIDRARSGADAEWKGKALEAVRATALIYSVFTTDHVLQGYPDLESCREPRAWGPVMLDAAKLKYCAPDRDEGTWDSTRGTCNARPKQVWRSLIGGTQDPRLIPDA